MRLFVHRNIFSPNAIISTAFVTIRHNVSACQ